MFGHRADGKRLSNIDPIVQFAPYIMPQRNDATNLMTEYLDYEPMAAYIRKRGKEGSKVSFMALMIAAYVRAISQYPELNRFIMNSQVFARNQIVVSLTVLRNSKDKDVMDEALIKMKFQPDATIDEVVDEIERNLKDATDEDADNGTVDFAAKLVHMRILVKIVVKLARLLDRYGLLPGWLYDISPFLCSMYITNIASIGMHSIYHHLYNFGNTSIFLAMGKFEKHVATGKNGVEVKNVVPLGVSMDERICGGAGYAQGMTLFKNCLMNPEVLEKRPEKVNLEVPMKQDKPKKAKGGSK